MDIRFLKRNEKEEMKHVLTYCFNIPEEKLDTVWEQTLQYENCLGVFQGNELAGSIGIFPYEIFFENNLVNMAGIGLVGTLPEYRHNRVASDLLIESLKIMRERKQLFSILGPFSVEYYRKYGWELAFEMKEYTLLMDNLKGVGTGKGEFRRLKPEDKPQIKFIYENFARHYNGPAKGEDRHWYRRPVNPNEKFFQYVLIDDYEAIQGYIYYSIKEHKFHIKELVYASMSAKKELLQFVYRHRPQANEIIWIAPPDDNTFLFLEHVKGSINRTIPGKMLRVVDVEQVIRKCSFEPSCDEIFTLKIDDPWLPWNHKTFHVHVKEGQAQVSEAGNEQADIQCSIQTFSQMVIGYISMEEVAMLDKLNGKNDKIIKRIEKLFPKKKTYINENF